MTDFESMHNISKERHQAMIAVLTRHDLLGEVVREEAHIRRRESARANNPPHLNLAAETLAAEQRDAAARHGTVLPPEGEEV